MGLKKNTQKIVVFIASVLPVAVVTVLFFLDDSMEWNGLKIISCITVDWWTFFIIPAVLYFLLKFKGMSFERSFAFGMTIGVNGILLILLAPYFGAKYYFQAKE